MSNVASLSSTNRVLRLGLVRFSLREFSGRRKCSATKDTEEYQTIRALPHNPAGGNWPVLGSHSQRSG